MARWILFDLGNVLIPFDHRRVSAALGRMWLPLETPAEKRAACEAEWHEFIFGSGEAKTRNAAVDTGKAGPDRHYDAELLRRELVAKYGNVLTPEQFSEAWCGIFDPPHQPAIDLMRELKGEGFKIGICSNTNRAHWEHCCGQAKDLCDLPDRLFLSFEMGLLKPSAEYFQHVIRETGAAPGDHLFLDDIDRYVEAARAAGMHALHVTPPLDPTAVRQEIARIWA